MAINSVIFAGVVKAAKPLTTLGSGTAIGKFTLGVDDSYIDKNKQMVMREFSIDVELWGALCLKHKDDIVEGNKLVVLGKLKLESWTDTSGAKRYKHVVIANQLEITGTPVPSLEDEVMKQREHVLYEENPF